MQGQGWGLQRGAGGAAPYIPPPPPPQPSASAAASNSTTPAKPKFECRICGTKLSRAEHLTRHQRRLHADKETLDNDPKMQHYRYALPILPQSVTVTAAGRWCHCSCAVCGKQCFDSHKLKVHMHNAHLEDAPFECTYCNKKFKAAANLRRHQKIHEKVSPPLSTHPIALAPGCLGLWLHESLPASLVWVMKRR